jgi:hypothetical protein
LGRPSPVIGGDSDDTMSCVLRGVEMAADAAIDALDKNLA